MAKRTTTEELKLKDRDTVIATDAATPIVYQMKVYLIGISPMIWRRFQISGNSTLSDLRYILQLVMGWSDTHLNQFIIHGKRYGVYHNGGIGLCIELEPFCPLRLKGRQGKGYETTFRL